MRGLLYDFLTATRISVNCVTDMLKTKSVGKSDIPKNRKNSNPEQTKTTKRTDKSTLFAKFAH